MLTEAEAWALLEQHCVPLKEAIGWVGQGFVRFDDWADVACNHVDLLLTPYMISSSRQQHGMRLAGAELRLALSVAHAVSCCRGLEPATSPAFWRSVIQTLWPAFGRPNLPDKLAFSPSTFAHVGITHGWLAQAEDGFWGGFLHGTPACHATLSAVLATLQSHMVADAMSVPLRVSLSLCEVSDPAWPVAESTVPPTLLRTIPYGGSVGPLVSPTFLRAILRAALDPPQETTTWPTPTHLGLVLEYCRDYADVAMRETLDLLARVSLVPSYPLQLTTDRLVIQFASPTPPHVAAPGRRNTRLLVARGRALGELLRHTLLAQKPVHTVSLSECSYADFRHVGAALSAVAWADPPVAELRCRGLCDVTQPQHKLLQLAWLAYALSVRCRRTPSLPLALALLSTRVQINQHESDALQQLMARGTPLRDVVEEALRLRFDGDAATVAQLAVSYPRLGSTVRLARGTTLYFEPLRTAAECVAVDSNSDDEEEVDLVAHVFDHGGFVGVVYAGYGLVWAKAASVVAWHRQVHDNDVAMEGDGDHAIASLCLSFENSLVDRRTPDTEAMAHRVVWILPLLACPTLQSLTLEHTVVLHDDLVKIFNCFPRLETLVLDRCVVESVDAFFEPTRMTPCIKTLSLLGVRDLRMRSRMITSARLPHDSLSIHPADGDAPQWLTPFVDALTSGTAHSLVALRALNVDIEAMTSESDERVLIERLAQAVASSSLGLTRLHVTCRQSLQRTCAELLGPLRDAVLMDPPRLRRAVLSVLRLFGCVGQEDVARVVLAMAEGSVVRLITWDATVNS